MPRDHTVLPATGNIDFPTFTASEAATRFSDLEGCKAELTWVVVISQDNLSAKDGHHFRNNRAVSWFGIEPSTASMASFA